MTYQQEAELESRYVMPTFGRKPVEFVEGSGMTLVDSEGREYLDFLSGIGVVSLGHCHPALVAAVSEQAAKLMHVSNYYYIEKRGEVARMLSDLLNAEVEPAERSAWKTFFANSGAEANECAIKLARLYARKRAVAAGKQDEAAPRLIVTIERSFHGRTLATLAATAQPAKQEAFQPLPQGFVATPLNDVAALEQLFAERGDEICAVMLECIQGESGVHPCTADFMAAARRLTAERGALLICDEVQCGIFRIGKPYGFQALGVTPDVVTMAKGIASGIPMGACAARGDAADTFGPGDHGSTFGGSNIAIAAAHATLTELSREGFGAHVAEVGAYLRERLSALPQVVEVRGDGLMVGADLAEGGPSAGDVVLAGLEAGLVLNAPGPRTLRFLPPLICEKAHVDALVERLGKLL
ncbi:aspartate aminotransferase family protein [Adlercreutzia sp. ZJ473]|uniref:aspartate aminotransferase family protein n=1 Tax=Adlercreutzia sp. ZJ473 TaxID=2722822 RepID=UPI0015552B12|nr:aspartate aminotransferase family protein [Adlercreutzia sp. ZJ473]